MENKTKFWLAGIVAILLLVIIVSPQLIKNPSSDSLSNTKTASDFNWRSAKLKDVRTGEDFTINQFKGQKVLIESFAVWCPTCTKQQKEIKKLHELVGDNIVSISLDTDPNEAESNVRQHLQRNGFNWRYSVSPQAVTKSLVDEFGVGFVNAPQAPLILIDEDGSVQFLRSGVKSAEELMKLIQG